MTEGKMAELDHLLIEALRAAEMRQGCTNHSYYAGILKSQILDTLAGGEDIEFPEKIMADVRSKYWFSEGVEVATIRCNAQKEKEIGEARRQGRLDVVLFIRAHPGNDKHAWDEWLDWINKLKEWGIEEEFGNTPRGTKKRGGV